MAEKKVGLTKKLNIMKLLLKLSWRNIWRNKRRSLLTILAVTFATFLSIAMRGIQIGTYDINIKTIVKMFSGYIQIQREGYQKNPSLNLSFKYNEQIQNIIKNETEITGFAPRIYADGLISFQDNSLGAIIFGVDPSLEKNVSDFQNKIKEGNFFQSDSTNEVVVGQKLLKNLNAKIGDNIIILSQGYDGSMGNMIFKISGAIKTGSPEFDAMAVFIGLSTAQELLGMYNRVNVIALSLTDLDKIEKTKTQLIQKLNNSNNLVVLHWQDVMPDLKQSIEFDNISGILFLGILIVIVAFGILNTVLMSVTERFREFGVTLSIGMPQIKLVVLVFMETFFITIIGLILGNIIAYGINYYIVLNPIVFSGDFAAIYEEYGFIPRMESSVKPGIFMNVSLSILIISFLACIYPAYKVYKLEPLKGIRYT
jgi:ABC-type lipoprotein release transport system permease subunit